MVSPFVKYRLPEVNVEAFLPISEEEVHCIIVNSSNESCKLDSLPTWLLKLCTNELTPVITEMVNLSLHEGHVPDTWKVAILAPLLNKFGFGAVIENLDLLVIYHLCLPTEKAVVNQLF